MPYCNLSKADVYYEDIGEGIPILMIHGYTPDHRLMSGCMEPILTKRDGWRRIYIDLPGMGRTKNVHQIRSSDDMLDAVWEFIQKVLPNQPYIVAGESYGGYIANGLIEKQKEHILAAVFICPVVVPLPENRAVEQHQPLKIDDTFIASLSEAELEMFKRDQVVLDGDNWERYKREVVSGCELADEPFLTKVKNQYQFSFEVGQSLFEKPSLFLLGRQDAVVGYRDALHLMDKYPRATFAVLDTAGHNLQIEQANVFNTLVHEWLDRVEEVCR